MTDMLGPYKAVLFDFDGTLADSYAAITASVNHVRAQHQQPSLNVEQIKRYVGYGADYLLTHTVPDGSLPDDLACYRTHHPTVMLALTHLLPGAAALLPAIKQVGKKLGLCSNKPRFFSQQILQHLGIATYFDVVVGPEDVPHPKPAPDMLLLAIQRLGLPRDQVLYVGDMNVDIQSARSAGVCVWAVATGSDERRVLEDAKPDRLLASLEEMVALLGK